MSPSISYILRKVESDLWKRVKHRALDDGLNMRDALLLLLEEYAAGRVKLKVTRPLRKTGS